jgi:hypothetical protein
MRLDCMSKLTESARGHDCIRCGAPDAYACHYNGFRQYMLGKGRGRKCYDLASAEFCFNCDKTFSEGSAPAHTDEIERSEEFLFWCIMTNVARHMRGDLK